MIQILLTLRFLACGSFYITIGDFCGISKPTVCLIVHRVSRAIAGLSKEFIHFPSTPEEIYQTQADFFIRFGFPGVVGCIDCKHVQIQSFGGPDAELFRNRDNYFSINTQVICNAHLEIIDIVARWPGSTHYSTIFNNSRIRANFEEGMFDHGFLLGDAGYSSLLFLLTPITEPDTAPEVLYNKPQIRSLAHIERLFGIWARQWAFLSGSRFRNHQKTLTAIVATAVLHNIVRRRNLQWTGRIIGNVEEYRMYVEDQLIIDPERDVRQQVMNNHFCRFANFEQYKHFHHYLVYQNCLQIPRNASITAICKASLPPHYTSFVLNTVEISKDNITEQDDNVSALADNLSNMKIENSKIKKEQRTKMMQLQEEEAFAILGVCMYELEHFVTDTYPELSAHFIAQSIHTSMYALSRFSTYFTTALSLSLACCIFDVFLMEGMEILFKVALTMLELGKNDVLILDMKEMLKFFQKEILGRAENKPDYFVNLAYSMKINTKRIKKLQVLRAEEEETACVVQRELAALRHTH
ncbi:hypothetical protein HCN44_003419 [Aphidius gifuensis]|uniref:Rab-GAP TBC domain-containing protein n=1 Tax=Aphidius gifuensis TaxID=684658 RepID=A0A834Y000_APHGI|nr:hypothetical protein HCN44_003419 [Aphidius gifuensis]